MAALIIVALTIWGVFTPVEHCRYEQTNNAQIDEYVNPVIARARAVLL